MFCDKIQQVTWNVSITWTTIDANSKLELRFVNVSEFIIFSGFANCLHNFLNVGF